MRFILESATGGIPVSGKLIAYSRQWRLIVLPRTRDVDTKPPAYLTQKLVLPSAVLALWTRSHNPDLVTPGRL